MKNGLSIVVIKKVPSRIGQANARIMAILPACCPKAYLADLYMNIIVTEPQITDTKRIQKILLENSVVSLIKYAIIGG